MEVSLSWLPPSGLHKYDENLSIIAFGNTHRCKSRSSDDGLYVGTSNSLGITFVSFVPKVILLWGLHLCISANIGIVNKHTIISIAKCKMRLGTDGDYNHGRSHICTNGSLLLWRLSKFQTTFDGM